MINFTIGPVQTSEEILKLGALQVPYFRTREFSELNLENEKMIKLLVGAEDNARAIFLTGSGTAGMEASILNILTKEDKILIVNGGTFGARFAELCNIYDLCYEEIKLESGKSLEEKKLLQYANKGFTALLVNHLETSTGVLYDIDMLGNFCKNNKMLFIVDAISSFISEELNMKETKIDAIIIGSQKALACPPGVSIIILSEIAIDRINKNKARSMYLNLKKALEDGERGQTPFTPAVGILIQLNARLKKICREEMGRIERRKIKLLANDFRERIKKLPFEIFSEALSNTVTPIKPKNNSAYEIFMVLKERYNIWVCPNGGELKDKIFRVGHIGELTIEDNDILIKALEDMYKKGEI